MIRSTMLLACLWVWSSCSSGPENGSGRPSAANPHKEVVVTTPPGIGKVQSNAVPGVESVEPSTVSALELVTNPSLEDLRDGNPVGFVCAPISEKTRAEVRCARTGEAHTGTNAMEVVRLNDGGLFGVRPLFSGVSASSVRRYFRAAVWMKATQGTIAVNLQSANRDWTKGYHQYYAETAPDWAEYSLLIQLEPGQEIGHFRICIGYGLTVNGERLLLDDFSFQEISEQEYARQMGLRGTASRIEWPRVERPVRTGPGLNRIRNASFENTLEHWGFSYTMQSRARSEQMKLDEAEHVQGACSLRYDAWPRWYEAGGRIQSAPISVETGKVYTWSAYLKSSEPGLEAVLEARYSAMQPPAATRTCMLSNTWQRYSLTFEVSRCPKGEAIACVSMPNTWLRKDDFSGRKIWVDAVQFEEGGLSDYAPSPVIELVGETSAPDSLFEEGEPVTLRTRIAVPESMPEASVPWTLIQETENVFGDIVDRQSFALHSEDFRGGGIHTRAWETGLLGSFCAHLRLMAGTRELAPGITVFAVLPKLTPAERAHAGFFGVETVSSPVFAAIVKKIGAGSVRLHSDQYFRWNALQQDATDSLWYETPKDDALRAMKAAGIQILANMELGSMWASTASASISGYDRILYPPELAAWRVFVGAQARHFKGLVDAWEIWNEPYLQHWWKGSAAEYVALLDGANEEIKKEDPSAQVAGICGQLSSGGWNQECVAAGALKNMDVLSFHAYLSRQSDGPEDEWIPKIKGNMAMVSRAGKNMPVWNSEFGVGDGYDSYYGPFYTGRPAPVRRSPGLLVQSYVVALAVGVERQYSFILSEDNGPSAPGGLALLEYNGTPKPVVPAFTACVKQLAGKVFHQAVDLGKGTVCFVFTGEGKPVAVLWRSLGAAPASLEFSAADIQGFDLMGNALATDAGKLPIRLDRNPIYLQGQGTVAECISALRQRISGEEPPHNARPRPRVGRRVPDELIYILPQSEAIRAYDEDRGGIHGRLIFASPRCPIFAISENGQDRIVSTS